MDMLPLTGRVALVTGSATWGGIGAAIALGLAQAGASVVVHGREVEREAGEDTVSRIARETGQKTAFYVADLADPAACVALINQCVAALGSLHILVNNAATVLRGTIDVTDAAFFDAVLAVNTRAPLLLVRAALPHLKATSEGGNVLNIGSINAHCGENNLLAYSVSKGGLMTLTRNLADALGRDNVRVNQINPGWVLTPNEYQQKLRDGLGPDWPETVGASFSPQGRLLTPKEIAAFALTFLTPPGSLAISGAVVDLEQFPVIGRNPPKR